MKKTLAVAGLALALAGCSMTSRQTAPPTERNDLLDKVAINDLLGRYYGGFGNAGEDFTRYYTDDATFDVNGHVAHGKQEIQGIYKGLATTGESPATRGTFHMLMTNPVVDVTGDTATASLLWTGILNTTAEAPPQFVEQGREYDRLVKKDGKWLISKRVVIADSGLPASFKDTYSQRKDYDITKE